MRVRLQPWLSVVELERTTLAVRPTAQRFWPQPPKVSHSGRGAERAPVTCVSSNPLPSSATLPPVEFWTRGWLLQLSPTATALLFALREALGRHSEPQYIHTAKRQRYGLSSDTWTKSRKELEAQGLLSVKREPQGDFYDFTRLRNAYELNLERLDDSPSWS